MDVLGDFDDISLVPFPSISLMEPKSASTSTLFDVNNSRNKEMDKSDNLCNQLELDCQITYVEKTRSE